MLTSATSVIERRTVLNRDFATHPYEAGWALEAIFFIRAEGKHPTLSIQAQVSPDGLNWIDRDVPVDLDAHVSMASIELARFGGWLRLVVTGASTTDPATVVVHLALKG